MGHGASEAVELPDNHGVKLTAVSVGHELVELGRLVYLPATDGKVLYFEWQENVGDLWLPTGLAVD